MASDGSDPFSIESLKKEVSHLIDQIESIREELFDYQKTFGHEGASVPLMSESELLRMRETLQLILGEAQELKRLKPF